MSNIKLVQLTMQLIWEYFSVKLLSAIETLTSEDPDSDRGMSDSSDEMLI